MEMKPVKSSNIKAVGYDKETNSLHVIFLSGGVYEYLGVPERVHALLMASDSIGKAINNGIIPNYKANKLTGDALDIKTPIETDSTAKCIVLGCPNKKNQGKFIGDLCSPCYEMLTTGIVNKHKNFISEIVDKCEEVLIIARGKRH